jgi:DNA-binding IclR family transcriptional regulator
VAEEKIVKSVGRVFEILELFMVVRTPLNAQSICEQLGYPQSSTIGLLKSMVALGYLAFEDDDKMYFPTARLSALGEWVTPELQPGGKIDNIMATLSDLTGETVYLAVQKQLQMQYLMVYPGTLGIALVISEGQISPLFGSAVGKAFLSTKTDIEIERLITRIQHAVPIDLNALLSELRIIRDHGYAAVFDVLLPGAGAVGFALTLSDVSGNYAIGVGGPTHRIKEKLHSIVDAAHSLGLGV